MAFRLQTIFNCYYNILISTNNGIVWFKRYDQSWFSRQRFVEWKCWSTHSGIKRDEVKLNVQNNLANYSDGVLLTKIGVWTIFVLWRYFVFSNLSNRCHRLMIRDIAQSYKCCPTIKILMNYQIWRSINI